MLYSWKKRRIGNFRAFDFPTADYFNLGMIAILKFFVVISVCWLLSSSFCFCLWLILAPPLASSLPDLSSARSTDVRPYQALACRSVFVKYFCYTYLLVACVWCLSSGQSTLAEAPSPLLWPLSLGNPSQACQTWLDEPSGPVLCVVGTAWYPGTASPQFKLKMFPSLPNVPCRSRIPFPLAEFQCFSSSLYWKPFA